MNSDAHGGRAVLPDMAALAHTARMEERRARFVDGRTCRPIEATLDRTARPPPTSARISAACRVLRCWDNSFGFVCITGDAAAKVPAKKQRRNVGGEVIAPARRRRNTQYKKRSQPAPVRPQHKTLIELTNKTCRWPHGRPGTDQFFFCGAPEADLERAFPTARSTCAAPIRRARAPGNRRGRR